MLAQSIAQCYCQQTSRPFLFDYLSGLRPLTDVPICRVTLRERSHLFENGDERGVLHVLYRGGGDHLGSLVGDDLKQGSGVRL